MHLGTGDAIVPPPWTTDDEYAAEETSARRLAWGVRVTLLLVAALIGGVFWVAATQLDPYDGGEEPLADGTHTQLGLPECSFKRATGKPCPSCGLTTSFALLIQGHASDALKVNWVGVLLAVFLVMMLPWALASVLRGRWLFIRSLERALLWSVGIFLALLLGRWLFLIL